MTTPETSLDTARAHRSEFQHLLAVPTRWMDNDVYGHVNNVVYYSYFDTAVNQHLIASAGLDIARAPVIGVVAETRCRFHQELSFPEVIQAGLRVRRLGRSSVVYRIGLFKRSESEAAATGHFVHVYVDRASRAPASIPDPIRAALTPLLAEAN